MMNIEQFAAMTQDVINWNAVARSNVHDFSEAAVTKQNSYIHEEVKETVLALMKNDSVEVLDGVADIFVTLIYKQFLINDGDLDVKEEVLDHGELDSTQVLVEFEYETLNIISLIGFYGIIENDYESGSISIRLLYDLINYVGEFYKVDMFAVVQNVMQSNWTKFPAYYSDDNYENECRLIEEKRGMKNVCFSTVEVDGREFVVFRDNGGQGKIMKPMGYTAADPAQFLPQ